MIFLKILDVEKSQFCTKCGSLLRTGSTILLNRSVGKSCSDVNKYEEKEHKWCGDCGKEILKHKLIHSTSKITEMITKL